MERGNKARQAFAEGTANFRHRGRTGSEILLLGVVLGSLALGAQAQTATEYQVKAAFLFNFAKFVEWPTSSFSDASAPLRMCVFGAGPMGQELRDITNGKMLNGRKLEVRDVADLQQAKHCQILFLSSSEEKQMRQILRDLSGTAVLTVGDAEGFAEQGGIINFVLENDRVQFEVNRKAAEGAGLKISSKLFGVAKLVIG